MKMPVESHTRLERPVSDLRCDNERPSRSSTAISAINFASYWALPLVSYGFPIRVSVLHRHVEKFCRIRDRFYP